MVFDSTKNPNKNYNSMEEDNKIETQSDLYLNDYSYLENSIDLFQNEKNICMNENNDSNKDKLYKIINFKKISLEKEVPLLKNQNIIEINKSDANRIKIFDNNNTRLKMFQLNNEEILYRKDSYYKHFKAILSKYIKNKANELKNKSFPYYSKNNFSSPNYKFIGNSKERDNFYFLSFTIKDILIYGKDNINQNRQYNNELIIKFIETNQFRAVDKNALAELIKFLNDVLENIIIKFYDDEIEYNQLKKDYKCIKFDEFYKRETGISLFGFLRALKQY